MQWAVVITMPVGLPEWKKNFITAGDLEKKYVIIIIIIIITYVTDRLLLFNQKYRLHK